MRIDPLADAKVRWLLFRSPRFQALLNESRRSIAAGKGLSRDEFWKAVKQRRSK